MPPFRATDPDKESGEGWERGSGCRKYFPGTVFDFIKSLFLSMPAKTSGKFL
jgi:hypothetical protein